MNLKNIVLSTLPELEPFDLTETEMGLQIESRYFVLKISLDDFRSEINTYFVRSGSDDPDLNLLTIGHALGIPKYAIDELDAWNIEQYLRHYAFVLKHAAQEWMVGTFGESWTVQKRIAEEISGSFSIYTDEKSAVYDIDTVALNSTNNFTHRAYVAGLFQSEQYAINGWTKIYDY